MTFELPSNVNKDKIFMVRYCNVTGKRLAPLFYSGNLYQFIDNSIFPFFCVGELVVYMKSGFASGKQDQANAENGIIQIRPTNINDDRSFVFDRNIYIDKAIVETRSADILVSGEVLFNNTNSQILVGKSIFFDLNGDYCCSNHITRIMPDESRVSAEYLTLIFNLYQRNKLFYKVCTNWNNQSGVNVEQLAQVKIPVPSLGKQKEITRFFNSAFKRKKSKENNANRLLASIDDYLLSELGIPAQQQEDNSLEKRIFYRKYSELHAGRLDPLAYKKERLDAIGGIKNGYYAASPLFNIVRFLSDSVKEIENNVSYIGLENIQGGSGEYIATSEKNSISSASVFNVGNILFPKLRPYLNKVFYCCFDGICSTEFHVLSSETENNEYIANFLRSRVVVSQTKSLMSGNTLPRLQTEDIRTLLIPVPPLEKQREMVAHIAEIRQQAKQLREEAAQELEQAKAEVEQMILGR